MNNVIHPIVVDGSQGEGGGQIFRTTLTIAMCLGLSVKIENIRAGRRKPGLLRQHLTCLRAAKDISDATVIGDSLGSTSVEFYPGRVQAGSYHFAIGSAGSSSLVFQTVLMPLLLAEGASDLTLEGGTHNGSAPSYDFIEQCFLPLIKRLGYQLETQLLCHGFYPAGGGKWQVRLFPANDIERLELLDRGKHIGNSCIATSARLPKYVVSREVEEVKQHTSWAQCRVEKKLVNSPGPGNILSLREHYEYVTEIIDVVGEKVVSAESVARKCINDWRIYDDSDAPVGEHLADQLLLPLLLGDGGIFRTLEPSMHLLTNIEVIKILTRMTISVKKLKENCWEIDVPKLNFR